MPAVADRPKVTPSMTLPDSFTPAACERIRHFNRVCKDAKTKRIAAFRTRDSIQADINLLNGKEPEKAQRLKVDWYHEMHEIDRLDRLIKRCNDEISVTIEKADQIEMFVDEEDVRPNVTTLFSEIDAELAAKVKKSSGSVIAGWRKEKIENLTDDAQALGICDDLKYTTAGEVWDHLEQGNGLGALGKAKLNTLTKAIRAFREKEEDTLKS